MSRLGERIAYVFWMVATILLVRFDLRTDDTGVEVFFLLSITFLLGCLHPRHAWQWAVLVGPFIPIGEWWMQRAQPGAGPWLLLAVTVAIGLAGSYAGALVRSGIAGQGSARGLN